MRGQWSSDLVGLHTTSHWVFCYRSFTHTNSTNKVVLKGFFSVLLSCTQCQYRLSVLFIRYTEVTQSNVIFFRNTLFIFTQLHIHTWSLLGATTGTAGVNGLAQGHLSGGKWGWELSAYFFVLFLHFAQLTFQIPGLFFFLHTGWYLVHHTPFSSTAMTDEQKARLSTKRPLTKEEYEARQSVIRKVVDPETGRTRWARAFH